MHGGATPAQVVIVHRGQVVMDQGIGMNRLDGAGGQDGLIFGDVMQAGAFHHQKPAQPLAALTGVIHRGDHGQIAVSGDFSAQARLDTGGVGLQPGGEHLNCRRAGPSRWARRCHRW